ncbi:hypothetical protein [Streptomyces sp. NPDC001815]|uniref:hypothetical protein n=1 Tax=Streptomyces sp. NPDC001815 TaxID=3154526 RepID=UPI00332DC443
MVPLDGWQRLQRRPLSQEPALPCAQTELPWRIQLAPRPVPRLGPVDVVQAGLLVGLRAVEGARRRGLPVGPVLCCHAHSRIHIPVEAGTAYRWHVPQTVCRAGRLWECALDRQVAEYSRCSTVWLLPPDGYPEGTDSAALHHWLALTRSAGVRNREALHGV